MIPSRRPYTPKQLQGMKGGSKSLSTLAWGIVATLFLVQVALFGVWLALPYIREARSRSHAPQKQLPNMTEVVGFVRSDIVAGFKEQKSKLSDMSADVFKQLREMEKALVGVASKLQQRETELSQLQQKLNLALENATATASRLIAMESEKKAASPPPVSIPVKPVAPAPTNCSRLQDTGRTGRISWNPKPGKYLLVMCTGGQLSNRMSCLRQHMLDAALLNRSLIFPSQGIDYDFEVLLDLQQPSVCFGNSTFITLNDYLSSQSNHKKKLVVNRFVCHVHSYQRNEICGRISSRFTPLGIDFEKTEVPQFKTPGPWYKYSTKEFLDSFSYDDNVIAFGNMFGVGGRDLRFHGSGPIKVLDSCRYYLTPSRTVLRTATGFVNTFLGSNFMAVHLRRGDFFQHCTKKDATGRHGKFPCFHPLQQIANCIAKRLDENPELKVIFLATNGQDKEIETLKEYLALLKKPVPLLRLMGGVNSPWAEPLVKLGVDKDPDVLAMVEKTVCVLGSVFYGTAGSTFSGDIARLRDWWFLKSCKDDDLCGTEDPDTIPILR